jgi:hypothetical protein
MLHGRRNSSWSGGFAVTDAALRPRPRHGNICCDIALGAAVRRGRPNPEAIALRKVADYSPAASAERSAARLAHQSGGLGVASSNLAAPTSQIKHLARRPSSLPELGDFVLPPFLPLSSPANFRGGGHRAGDDRDVIAQRSAFCCERIGLCHSDERGERPCFSPTNQAYRLAAPRDRQGGSDECVVSRLASSGRLAVDRGRRRHDLLHPDERAR